MNGEKKKTVIITGVTGFLGSHLLRALHSCNEFKIVALKRSSSDCHRIKDLLNTEITFFDVDTKSLTGIFEELKVANIIIHTATDYGRNKTISNILSTNLIFPIQLIETGMNYGLELFVNTDSYFNKDSSSYTTLLDYSLSKKSLNLWLKYFANTIQVANFRLEHIYGPYDNGNKFVQTLVNDIVINNKESIELTYGHQKRDFIYIDDVVRAYLTIIDNYESHYFKYKLFEVGTGKCVSIRDFVEQIKLEAKSDTRLDFGALPYREDEIMSSYADITDLQEWGWQPHVNYVEGIAKTLSYYR